MPMEAQSASLSGALGGIGWAGAYASGGRTGGSGVDAPFSVALPRIVNG